MHHYYRNQGPVRNHGPGPNDYRFGFAPLLWAPFIGGAIGGAIGGFFGGSFSRPRPYPVGPPGYPPYPPYPYGYGGYGGYYPYR